MESAHDLLADVGLIGLSTMGSSLARSIAAAGLTLAVFNRTNARTRAFVGQAASDRLVGPDDLRHLAARVKTPRRIFLAVRAGQPVDDVLAALVPHLSPGDILLDCGNSHYSDTERRQASLAKSGITLLGVGTGGVTDQPRSGPGLIVGGAREAYDLVEPLLASFAARSPDGPGCVYVGTGGSGHYVKMVHNGCEYAVMQCIAESYDLLAHGVGLSAAELAVIFDRWNEGDLGSHLMAIAAQVLKVVDDRTGRPLVDLIVDRAGHQGTGMWTSREALDLEIPVPTIDASVSARYMSDLVAERLHASALLHGPVERPRVELEAFVEATRRALYCSVVAAYAQAMSLMVAGSRARGYNLNSGEIARAWKVGHIVRSRLLDVIQEAYDLGPTESPIANLMLDPIIANELNRFQGAWRFIVVTIRSYALPCPAMSASLDYFDGYRQPRSPANLIQAMRDHFGSHGYERVDQPGSVHSDWQEN